MSQKVRKAVVTVAGRGTRFLPATKAMPKEMIPILDKPIIQYIAEELVESGIEDIILVTNSDNVAIENHFDYNAALVDYLVDRGKDDYANLVTDISEMANFIYIRQKGPYGNGTPCYNAKDILGDESFVYVFGDDLVKTKKPFTKQIIEKHERDGGMVIGVQQVPDDMVHKYGIAALQPGEEDLGRIDKLVEKPQPDETPSRLAQFGRFVLTPEIFNYLNPDILGKGNELWLTDAIEGFIRDGGLVTVKEVEDGKWYTTGDPVNYFRALLAYAADRKDIRESFGEEIDWGLVS